MHESNDDSSMTLHAVKREDINTLEDISDTQLICKIMPFNQWLDAVDGIYESEGIRLATEQAKSVKCPTDAEQAHEFLAAFVAHTQWELNNIRELARQGRATPDMNIPYIIPFIPEPKEGDTVENCSMWDIAVKVKAFIDQ